MATASELLLEQEEPHFIISEDLRTVTIPYGQNVIGVFSDENVRRIWFDMPDTCDGTDLSDFQISINYINALKESGRYYVTDSTVADGTITFSWLVSRAVCASEGKVQFVVCLRLFDTDNETILKEFNTTITTMNVLVGIEAELEITDPQQDAVNSVIGPAIIATNDATAAALHAEGAADDAEEATTAAVEATETATELIAAMVNINERAIPLMSETVRGGAKLGSGLDIVNGALTLAGGDIAGAVDDWLDDHPEATTTVEDGSITEVKLQEDFKALLAHVDGYHQLLGAGTSDALMSTDGEVDTFAQRVSDHDGACRITSLRGNTVRWNQLNNNSASTNTTGLTRTYNADGSVTLNGTSTGGVIYFCSSVPLIGGHKYLVKGCPANGSSNTYFLGFGGSKIDSGNGGIATINANITSNLQFVVKNGVTFNNMIMWPQFFDLTAMFGAGNEPSTVAEFEAQYPEDYYPYDAGSLQSVNIEGVESVGRNCVIAKYQNMIVNANGTIAVSSGTNVYVAEVDRNTDYTLSAIGKNRMRVTSVPTPNITAGMGGTSIIVSNDNLSTFNSGSADYVAIYVSTGGESDVQLERGSTATPYKPYHKSTRALPISTYFPNGMRGVGSAHDELDTDKAVTRVGAVDLGTLNWVYIDTGLYFYANITSRANGAFNLICPKYEVNTRQGAANLSNMQMIGGAPGNAVYIKDTSYSDAATFKAAMSGVMLYYELATPTTTPIDPPLNLTYPVEAGGTESIVVPTGATSAAPTFVTLYAYDADGIIDKAQSIIAQVESGTASTNYAVNSYLVMRGTLYRVTSAIATGETITPGTNCVATTIMAELVRLTS